LPKKYQNNIDFDKLLQNSKQARGFFQEKIIFSEYELSIINKHAEGSNRIRLIWESMPKARYLLEEVFGINNSHKNYDSRTKKGLLSFANRGGYVTREFKKGIRDFAKVNMKREDRMAKRISDAAQDPSVTGVVGYTGHVHTRLGHLLIKRGHKVVSTFAHKEGGITLFDPEKRALRHKIFLQKDPSDKEWYTFLLGKYLMLKKELEICEASDRVTEEVSHQKCIRSINRQLSVLKGVDIETGYRYHYDPILLISR
jgi:hypothetical protein